ncbi:MAG: hypothetical protein Q4F17_02690 [Eubacteriales bacterium]|nr:hypothetical protein [Eubacteriales bacterium]
MLFRKKIEHACAYCIHGAKLEDGQVLCAKKGLKAAGDKCFRFRYDPLKRVPLKARALDLSRYENEDYTL